MIDKEKQIADMAEFIHLIHPSKALKRMRYSWQRSYIRRDTASSLRVSG